MNGFGRGTEVLGENLPQRHFVDDKSHLTDPGANPGRRGGKPATNRFSYCAADNNFFLLIPSNSSGILPFKAMPV
jgi:hypothetical protein